MIKFKKYCIFFILISIIFLSTSCKKVKVEGKEKGKNKENAQALGDRHRKDRRAIDYQFQDYKVYNFEKDDIKISFEGNSVNLTSAIYNDRNRLYIPIDNIMSAINGSVTFKDNLININFKNKTVIINEKEKKYWFTEEPSVTYEVKKNLYNIDGNVYISLVDLSNMLDLKTRWNIDKKEISLFWNREKIVPVSKNQTNLKPALIRLEDIAAGQRYETSEQLEKLRAVGDYLYSQGIPFHIAWVPRYINKTKSIDNDPSKTYNMYNADFVFTMDYLIHEKGIIGLHGYTHQNKDELSIDGIEFSRKNNVDEKSVRERLEAAIKAANDLDLHYEFFESPHYAATDFQHKIMEDYFKYIYDPSNINPNNIVEGANNKTKYVPTPLDYVDGKEDLNNMIRKIDKLKRNSLGSFFYHPSIEFEFIKLNSNDGEYPSYDYDSKSVLHQIIDTFDKDGFKFTTIDNL